MWEEMESRGDCDPSGEVWSEKVGFGGPKYCEFTKFTIAVQKLSLLSAVACSDK